MLNGSCGVGKSTLAKQVHNSIPLSVLIDIDILTNFISDGIDGRDKEMEWKIVIQIAKNMLRASLEHGSSVIIDKMIYDANTLDEFVNIANEFGAEIDEIILQAKVETVLNRAEARGFTTRLTRQSCIGFWEKIEELSKARNNATILNTTELTAKGVFERLKEMIKI